MTGYEDVHQRLRDAFDMLENIALDQASAEPKRADKVKTALGDVTAALDAVEAWQRDQQDDQRLAALIDGLARYTTAAHERLVASEARLAAIEEANLVQGRRGIQPKPDLLNEGRFLAGMLAGPPDDGVDPQYFKDAGRATVVASIDVLALELASRVQTAGKSGAKS